MADPYDRSDFPLNATYDSPVGDWSILNARHSIVLCHPESHLVVLFGCRLPKYGCVGALIIAGFDWPVRIGDRYCRSSYSKGRNSQNQNVIRRNNSTVALAL